MAIKQTLLVSLLITMSGCFAPGFLVTDTVRPFWPSFDQTPAGETSFPLRSYRFTEPYSGFFAEWADKDIKEVAHKGGLKEMYYVDLHTFSLLFGIFRQRTLVMYGR